jgi:general secretion pathway protein B
VLPPAPPPVIVERVRVVAAPAVAATVAKPGAPARAAGPAVVATAQPAAATPQPAATTAQPAAPPAAPAAAAAPAADRVFAVTELPADVQKDLPKLAITGGVHSENPAQRMLVVGGKVVNEGAELAPGVVLDQIRPRSAVLKFRGWKYSVGY